MDFTTNCTRVQTPEGTSLRGRPLEFVSAPATKPDFSSDHIPSTGTNDGVVLNPPGRATPEGKEKKSKQLIRCRANTIISTFNTRTIGSKSRLHELVSAAKKQSTDIIAIQEHRIYHPHIDIKHELIDGYYLVTSSATKNTANATIGGVGFLISPIAYEHISNVEEISSRLLVLELNGNPKVTLISAYSPHNSSDETEVDRFYNDLRSILDNVPAHNLLFVPGDFNAKLGPNDVKFTFNKETNRNGEKLLDLMEEYNLFASNAQFMKPTNQLWTFEYPNGDRAQIDYILCRKKWRNSVRNCRSYSTFSAVGSDHRIVSATIKLSLRISKRTPPDPMKTIDWSKVCEDPNLSSKYALDVFNRFGELSTLHEDGDIESQYTALMEANEEIALSTLPKKAKSKKTPFNTIIISDARENVKKLSLEYHSKPSSTKKRKLTMAKKKLDNAYLDAEAAYIEGQIKELKLQHKNKHHASAWKTINRLSDKKAKSPISVNGRSKIERLSSWSNHFKGLLGKEPTISEHVLPRVVVSEPLNIPTAAFTFGELTYVLTSFKTNKAFGPDKIPTIIWKDPTFHQLLLDLCNNTYDNLRSPLIWKKSQIVPIPKKGNLKLVTNYRGISLLPIAAKIYNKLILNRLIPYIDPILRNNQNGFRKGRSTLSQILTIRRIIEEITRGNLEAVLLFVDFRKAFDSVHREKMFEILELYGIPHCLIDAIKVLYTDTTATIITSDGETDPFNVLAGILQGDTLAPFLFIIVLDYVLRISLDNNKHKGIKVKPRKSSRFPAIHETDVDFADDLALLANSLTHAQDLLISLETAANSVGLYLNEDKTEYLHLTPDQPVQLQIESLSGEILKCVDDFKYLGSFVMSSEKDFQTRKALAWTACNKLATIWRSKLSRTFKVNIFRATIEPILFYGSETWTLSARLQKRLDGCYTRLLRRVQNISWKQHPTISTIYGKLPLISQTLKQRRLQFAGHCLRATSELSSSFVLWRPQSRGRRSRKLSYPDTLSRDSGYEAQDLETVMQDRELWRSVVNSISTEVAP